MFSEIHFFLKKSIELDDHPSEFSHFKILPCYRYQNERSKFIQFDDEILVSTAWDESLKDSFMVIQKKFSSSQNADEQSELEENEEEAEFESQFTNELSISVEKSTKYRLRFYSSFDDQSQSRILFGDIVWISLIERKSHLQFELEQIDPCSNETNSKFVNMEDNRCKHIEKHFEILQKRNKNLHFEEFQDNQSKNTIGMWQIQGESLLKGGFLAWDSKIRLRHLSSGLYLAVKPINNEGTLEFKRKIFILTMEKRITDDSLFIIKNKSYENNSQVLLDSFFHLIHQKSGLSFGLDQENFMKAGNLNEKVLWKINMQQNISQENMMRFLKADPQEIWETRFLLSCLPIMRLGIKLIENVFFCLFKDFIKKIDESGNYKKHSLYIDFYKKKLIGFIKGMSGICDGFLLL